MSPALSELLSLSRPAGQDPNREDQESQRLEVEVALERRYTLATQGDLLDQFSPSLDQLTLAEFLTRGDYDRHVRRARGVYRGRRDRLIAALTTHLPQLKVEGVAAGLHLLLRTPPWVDDNAIAQDARGAGIRVAALSAFRIKPANSGGLVIGYGRVPESAIEPAVRELARAVRPHL